MGKVAGCWIWLWLLDKDNKRQKVGNPNFVLNFIESFISVSKTKQLEKMARDISSFIMKGR